MNPDSITSGAIAATKIHVFTYGTLRPGMGLDRILRGAVVTAETATVDGYALYSNTSRSYPYLVAEAGSEATGTLYLLRDGEQFRQADRIERGAGYTAASTRVKLADGTMVEALVWEWRKPWGLGERIPSGDWCVFAEEEQARWAAPVR